VQNAIFPLLNRDREATQALFEIIKNQPGYK
jgi:type I restriction enzyme R subunit